MIDCKCSLDISKSSTTANLAFDGVDDTEGESSNGFIGSDILNSVGCYHIENIGIQLFSKISGDYFTILGMPLLPLLAYLKLHKIGGLS